jgi:hypothetical protein
VNALSLTFSTEREIFVMNAWEAIRHMRKTLAAVTAFSIAFGFVEAVVVVYLRLHFYPGGFSFPIVQVPTSFGLLEVLREAATVIMLGAVGWISAQRPLARFAYAAVAFGVWDIFYYIFLKIILDWPASLFTWDVLFLIPVPWLGPVLAPVIVSLCLIAASLITLQRETAGRPVITRPAHRIVAGLGGILVLWSFLVGPDALAQQEPPGSFPWLLFAAGICAAIAGFVWALSGTETR